jgi:hypothetical protein
MIRRDPIVEEVRKHREAIAREHGNDLEAIVAALENDASSRDDATVSFPPKRIDKHSVHRTAQTTRRPGKTLERTARS